MALPTWYTPHVCTRTCARAGAPPARLRQEPDENVTDLLERKTNTGDGPGLFSAGSRAIRGFAGLASGVFGGQQSSKSAQGADAAAATERETACARDAA